MCTLNTVPDDVSVHYTGVSEAFKADSNSKKINLGVGAYVSHPTVSRSDLWAITRGNTDPVFLVVVPTL
jgi:hypothetical protein